MNPPTFLIIRLYFIWIWYYVSDTDLIARLIQDASSQTALPVSRGQGKPEIRRNKYQCINIGNRVSESRIPTADFHA
ncbi:MAG: hypothetical protein LBE91_04145 [Tannerella sp.]|nr:hypothetical protein [Tannerella sp.]